jgi:tetratricopeptide (TPR) repeat protein
MVLSQDQNPELQRGIAEFTQENYEEAVDSLQKARSAFPASSLPSYYLGMSYKKMQNYSEAKKYLREALNLLPRIKEAVLELAEVHYQLGELDEARDMLIMAEADNVRPGQTAYVKGLVLSHKNENLAAAESFAKAGKLSPALVQSSDYQTGQAFARNFLDLIQKKKKELSDVRAYLGVHFQYDDNVVLKPGDEDVATVISDDDDSRLVVTGGVEYARVPRRPLDFSAHYSLYVSNHNDLSAFDVISNSIAVVPSFIINDRSKVGVAVRLSHSQVDDKDYLSSVAISPTYTRHYGKNHTMQAYFSFAKKDFLNAASIGDEDRDALEFSGNISWFYFFKQDRGILVPFMETFELSSFGENEGYINVMYQLAKEETDGTNWENYGNKVSVIYLIPLFQNAKFRLAGDIKLEDFTNIHTVFNNERQDIIYGISGLLFYKIHENFDIQLMYFYRRDDSNIAVYDYERNVYSIGIEMRYQ